MDPAAFLTGVIMGLITARAVHATVKALAGG
jgi:hypothetical protein